jgi:hypothetical protein
MAGLKEFYCRSNETTLGSQFKWLEYTFNADIPLVISSPSLKDNLGLEQVVFTCVRMVFT